MAIDSLIAVEVQASSSFNNDTISVKILDSPVERAVVKAAVKRTDSFIRAHDLNLCGRDIPRVVDDERNDAEISERDKLIVSLDGTGNLVIKALVEIGLSEAGDESSRWIATSSTATILKRRDSKPRGEIDPWKNAACGTDVLVWSAKCTRRGHGEEYPVIKARGLIFASAREVVDLLRDSSKVATYNKSSLGRKDKIVLTKNTDSETKIMSSLTKPPIVLKPLECLSLFHSRQLTSEDNVELDGAGYITVGRSVWENEQGRHDGSNSAATRCEILLSVNLVRDINHSGGKKACELTVITHVATPSGVPLFIGKRAALIAADGFIKDIRAVFER